MDAFDAGDWHTAERVIMEIKETLSKQVLLNPPDAATLNPFIDQANADLDQARRNRRAEERVAPPVPVASSSFPHPPLAPRAVAPPATRRSPRKHDAPRPETRRSPRAEPSARRPPKSAKHDWGASARTRGTFGSDDDDDDCLTVDEPKRTRVEVPRGSNGTGGFARKGLSDARHGDDRIVDERDYRAGRRMNGPANVDARDEPRPRHHQPDTTARNAASEAFFVSARNRLDTENASRNVPSSRGDPVRGDRNGNGDGTRSGGAAGDDRRGNPVERNGFVPPYARKPFPGVPSNARGGSGPGRASGRASGEGPSEGHARRFDPSNDSEPPFGERTMRRLSPNGEDLPESLLRMDRDIVDRVVGEILEDPVTIAWDDIAGLEHAKQAVMELAVWPLVRPELFRGARAVPKGVLLFGPPGTGKTLIGRAVASQCGATFFNISASSLTSKWIGEGEKMVRALFAVARRCEPAVIFVDEIDSLLSARKSEGEHESSRRMKTEFLVQMDGCSSEDGRVLLIGATNRPQELDDGARRRLSKQLYIPLPCPRARRAMIANILNADASVAHALSDADLDVICEKTNGYSGSDMKHLTQEAARAPLRELFASVRDAGGNENVSSFTSSGAPNPIASPSAMRPIALADFKRASKQVRPSVTQADIEFHEKWNRDHGAMSGFGVGEEEEEEDDW
jgi:AAA+ superfamily predicted ATPase